MKNIYTGYAKYAKYAKYAVWQSRSEMRLRSEVELISSLIEKPNRLTSGTLWSKNTKRLRVRVDRFFYLDHIGPCPNPLY